MTQNAQRIFASGREKGPAVWKDKNGVTHQAKGDQMIPSDRGTFIMWTVCGKKDIPANAAHLGSLDSVDCPECRGVRK